MEYNELIKARHSVRKYSEKKVSPELLREILEAGRLAPTARNMQVQRILAVQSDAGIAKLNECSPCLFGASTVLVAAFDTRPMNGNYGRVDASIALAHMMLKAADLGLGTVWVGIFDHDELHEQFNIPEEYEIVSILPVGYPAEDSRPSAMHEDRLPLADTVQFESY